MIGVCKLLFDLCFYYMMSGYFSRIFGGDYPWAWGVPVLLLPAIALEALGEGGGGDGHGVGESEGVHRQPLTTALCCVAPGLVAGIIFLLPTIRISVWQLAQFLPAWAYFGISLWSDRVYTNRSDFEEHFRFTWKIGGLAVLGLLAHERVVDALTGAAPYLVTYLLAGICLMRVLRDEGERSAERNAATLLLLLFGSFALALAEAPRLIMGVVGFFYETVVVRLLMGVALAIGVVIYGVFGAIGWLFAFLKADENDVRRLEIGGGPQETAWEEAEALLHELPAWIEIIAVILLALALAYMVYAIMRRLLGHSKEAKSSKYYTEKQERLGRQGRRKRDGWRRPHDPRQAIRWYYRKYLKEGVSRGAQHLPSDTSLSIQRKFTPFFPGGDGGALRDLYTAARYRHSGEPGRDDADTAADIWRRLSG